MSNKKTKIIFNSTSYSSRFLNCFFPKPCLVDQKSKKKTPFILAAPNNQVQTKNN